MKKESPKRYESLKISKILQEIQVRNWKGEKKKNEKYKKSNDVNVTYI